MLRFIETHENVSITQISPLIGESSRAFPLVYFPSVSDVLYRGIVLLLRGCVCKFMDVRLCKFLPQFSENITSIKMRIFFHFSNKLFLFLVFKRVSLLMVN